MSIILSHNNDSCNTRHGIPLKFLLLCPLSEETIVELRKIKIIKNEVFAECLFHVVLGLAHLLAKIGKLSPTENEPDYLYCYPSC